MRGTTERRDCRQAAVSAAGTAVWLLAAAAVLLWVRQAFFPSGAASVLLAVLAAVQAAGLIPLGLALRDRLKEIKGGELYEEEIYVLSAGDCYGDYITDSVRGRKEYHNRHHCSCRRRDSRDNRRRDSRGHKGRER